MSTIDSNVSVSSTTGVDGNSYTTTVSNDTLTNEDFLTLMLTELSLQDPTKPMDSSTMMDNQMQMSTMEANMAMVEAMEGLTASFAQTTLADSTNMIGRIVENGELNEDNELKQYQISSVSSIDGQVYASAYEVMGYDDMYYFEPVENADAQIANGNDDGDSIVITKNDGTQQTFSTEGKTYNELAQEIATVDGFGADVVETADGTYQLVVAVSGAGSNITQNGIDDLSYSKDQQVIFSNEAELIDYTTITKVY